MHQPERWEFFSLSSSLLLPLWSLALQVLHPPGHCPCCPPWWWSPHGPDHHWPALLTWWQRGRSQDWIWNTKFESLEIMWHVFEACAWQPSWQWGKGGKLYTWTCTIVNIENLPEFQEAISQSNSKVMACSVIPLPQEETVLLSACKVNCDHCPVVDLLRQQLLGELHPSTAI